MATTTFPVAARDAKERSKPWLERLARGGFVAKALIYFLMGLLPAAAALGAGGHTTDSRGALSELLRAPFGRVLLAALAVGLLGHAVWRFICAFTDGDQRGTSSKGLRKRAGAIGKGILYTGLAGSAASLAIWATPKQANGAQQRHWIARALELPGGRYLVGAVGIGLVSFGAFQLVKAWRAKLSDRLQLHRCSATSRRLLVGVSRFGIAARGIVFGTIGALICRAALHRNPREGGGLADGMRKLLELGTWPFLGIAFGLVAYGVYQLVEARYRRVRVD